MPGFKSLLKGLLIFEEPEKIERFILKEPLNEGNDSDENVKGKAGKDREHSEEDGKTSVKGYKVSRKPEKDEEPEEESVEENIKEHREEKGKEHREENDNEHREEKGKENREENDNEHREEKGKELGEKNFDENLKADDWRRDSRKVRREFREENRKTHSEKEDRSSISKRLSENLEYLKKRYTIPDNSDIMLREFDVIVQDRPIPAFIIFIDGMTDRKVINDDMLQPLMLLSNLDIKNNSEDITEYIKNHILPHNQLKIEKDIEKVIDEVNFGGCALFVDGIDAAFSADVKGWEHRGVERPNAELVLRGPQEGFTELLRANTALIRKMLKDEDLVVEGIEVGKRSKTPCSVLYIKDIANDSLVKEVKRRVKGISVDYIIDSGELEQFIEDSTIMPAPQILATERPDRVASMLTEGRVAIIMNGSPYALVIPVTHHDLMHSPEDSYVRFPYANLLRIIRIIAAFMSILVPGLYIAITNYHHEMIPTQLLFAIEASREKVPFPSVVEIIIMELSFELIREAGIRIPGPLGPTIGIIGAVILGQAAVAANIVSPILIVIVAVTGLGSFAIPSFALGFSFRITRFLYIFLGAAAGFLGITTGIYIYGAWLVYSKSFGVPFISPNAPKMTGSSINNFLKYPIWMQEKRPDYMNPKDIGRQPKYSRKWLRPEEEGS